jgi:hypothetical protein
MEDEKKDNDDFIMDYNTELAVLQSNDHHPQSPMGLIDVSWRLFQDGEILVEVADLSTPHGRRNKPTTSSKCGRQDHNMRSCGKQKEPKRKKSSSSRKRPTEEGQVAVGNIPVNVEANIDSNDVPSDIEDDDNDETHVRIFELMSLGPKTPME